MKNLILIISVVIIFSNTISAQTAAYVTTSYEPWGQTSNIIAFNTIYGVEGVGWKKFLYNSTTINEIFSSERKLVFIEGGNSNTSKMIALLNSDWPAIESWISNGGSLIVNAATNEIYTKFEIGSSGIYSERILTSSMQAYIDAAAYPEPPHVHPLLTDKKYPAFYSGEYLGNSVAHNIITGNYTSSIFSCPNGSTMVEKLYGSGKLIVGGLTLPWFITVASWQPQPQVSNLLYIMISWAKELNKSFIFNSPTLTEDVMKNDTDHFGNDLYITDIPYLEYGNFISFNLETGEFVYEAPTDWNGTFNFTCTISNGIETYEITITMVIDTIPPVVVSQNASLQLNSEGIGFLIPEEVDNGSYDNIGISKLTLDKTTFSCDDLGNNTVTLTATDVAGNTSEATAIVTVTENIAPAIIAEDYYVLTAPADACSAPADFRFYTEDNCSMNGNIVFNGNGYGNLEGWKINSIVSNSWIAVNGGFITSFHLTAKHQIIDLLAQGYNAATLDAAPEITVSEDYIGTGPLNYNDDYFLNVELRDANGNTIDEFRSGNLICSEDVRTITHTFTSYGEGVRYIFVEHGGKDAEGWTGYYGPKMSNLSVLVNAPHISPNLPVQQIAGLKLADEFPVGITQNTYRVMDLAGNVSTTEFDVVVDDNTPPEVITKNITVQLDADGTATIEATDIDDGSSDACGIQSRTMDITGFDCSDVNNPVTVTLTVTDINNNSANATAVVTVNDNVPPVVDVRPLTIYLRNDGSYTLNRHNIETITKLGEGTIDNCSPYDQLDITVSPDKFTCEHAGTKVPVTVTVTDALGNTSTAETTVWVIDMHAPHVMFKDTTLYLDSNGSAYLTASDLDGGITDVCGVDNIWLDVTSFDCSHVGNPVDVILTAVDVNGNSASDTAMVTIEDKIIPTVKTRNITVELDETGNAEIVASDIDNGSFDNCGIETMSLSKTAFNCADLGANTVELTITDKNGNSNSSTALVTVNDNVAPVVAVQPLTIYLQENGTYTLNRENIETVTKAGGGTNDNCSAYDQLEISISPDKFTCEHAGISVPVTVTVTDASGNTSTGETAITVIDMTAPHVLCKDTILYLDRNGSAYLTASDLNAGSSDPCGIDSTWLDVTSFNSSNTGKNIVTLFAEDAYGNLSSCVSTVTVTLSNTAPFVLNPILDKSLVINQFIKIPVSVYDIFSDPDGDELKVEVFPEKEDILLSWLKYENDTLYFSPSDGDECCENLVVRATDPSGLFATHTFSVCIETGLVNSKLTEATNVDVKVYPNPANKNVNVEFSAGNYDARLSMIDSNGRLVLLQRYYSKEKIVIDVSDIVPGMYLLKIDTEKRQIIKKLIVLH